MKLPAISFARVFVLLQAFSSLLIADAPPLLTTGVEIGSSNERTALSRTTRKLSSTVDVKIKNTSDRLLEAPLHAVISFTPLNGGNLAGLTMPGALGGVGVAPYQTFYKDLSASIGNGLAVGAETTFSFTFERPEGTTVSYAVAIRGIRNNDPDGLIGGPYSGQLGSPLPFDASNSTDPDGEALTFSWDFGDGSTGTGAKPQHAYSATGLFSVVVTVSDPRGAVVTRETQVPISPPGAFALARTRTLDGNGHPLGTVAVTQSGPDGSRTFQSDTVSGFTSLGGQPGDHTWSFAREGYLTSFRKTTLTQGSVKVVSFPWLAPLNASRTTLSLLNPTSAKSLAERVTLTLPPEAFEQVVSVALTDLHGQNLPLPLPYGWSPLAAFHLDAPATSAADIAASVKLLQAVPPSRPLVLVHLATATPTWLTESLHTSPGSDTLAVVLRKPGSYAVVIADTLPAGNPALAEAGQSLPAGAAAVVAPEVTAAGVVNPAATVASLDPARVTATATVDFTNGTQPLASGAWFLADVEETYDLRDGQAFKTPDYDATFYAYQIPGDASASTATASFPLRPRILFGPDQLTEANLKVDVLALNQFSGGIVTQDGGLLSLPGLRIGVPAGAVAGPSAAEIRLISTANLSRFLGEFQPLLAFELNLPRLADGASLDLGITQKLVPDSNYVLARCVNSGSKSGLQPVQRLRSDSQGKVTSAEPASGPKLPGITGSGQYVVVKINEPQALITGLVRKVGGALLPGALVSVSAEPWLSLTGGAGTFSTLAKPGERTVTGSDPADGNSGQATASLANAASTANVEIQTAPTGPRVVATTPVANDPKASKVAPIILEFSEPIQPGSFGATGIRLRDVAANVDVPGSLSLDLSNRKATLLPLNPLNNATDYQIIVSNAILDRQNLPIEGTLTFPFKTAPSDERPAGAQLVIYEPGADAIPLAILDLLVAYDSAEGSSHVVAHGSPGTADPEVPVILVNQNTGATATVLSKPDGSFANFIDAAEEDFIEAVFVNSNGTRVTVPATRQIFDNGRIGLYKYGGILEAESDGGPVQVLIEPEAIPSRTTFKIEVARLEELLIELQNQLPVEGKLLGGVRLEINGDELKIPADVKFPVSVADLEVPGSMTPEEGVYALCEKVEFEGAIHFGVVDKMEYENGALVTRSPPYPGFGQELGSLLYMPVRIAFGSKATIVGRLVSAPEGADVSGAAILAGTPPLFPQVGALVNASSGGDTDTSGRLRPGAFVARTNQSGFYTLVVPEDVFNPTPILLRGFASRFPGLTARSVFTPRPLLLEPGQVPVFTANLIFNLPTNNTTQDQNPPRLSARTTTAVLPIQQDASIMIEARDDQSTPQVQSIEYLVSESTPLVAGETLLAADVVLRREATVANGASLQIPLTLLVRKAALIAVRVQVVDAAGNERETIFKFRFGPPPPLTGDDPPPSDGKDKEKPRVITISPTTNAILNDPQVVLSFSERVRREDIEEIMDGGDSSAVVTVTAKTGKSAPVSPIIVRLGPEGTSALVRFSGLRADTEYSASVATSGVRDLNGNFMADYFTWTFRTAPETAKPLAGLTQAIASVVSGPVVVSIGRDGGGTLVTHRVGDTQSLDPKGKLSLPDFPRALAAIGMYSFKRTPTGAVETRRLVAVTGGLVGEGNVGPWLWVVDVTDPANPTRLASSLVTADFASTASMLKWDPPYLMAGILTAERNFIYHINLQAFILGSNGQREVSYKRGLDLSGDGDFVDPGEQLPVPERQTLFGLEFPLGLDSRRSLLDFDSQLGGSVLVAALGGKDGDASRLAVLTFQGQSIDDGAGPAGVVPLTNPAIKRVALDLDFLVTEASGVRRAPVAITVRGDLVEWWDLTNPGSPVALTRPDGTPVRFSLGALAPGATAVSSLARTGPDEYTIASPAGLFVFDRKRLGDFTKPFEVAALLPDAPMPGGRTFGGDAFAFSVGSGQVQVVNRAPRLSVVRFPAQTPQSIDALLATGESALGNLLETALEQPFLQPVIFPEVPGETPAAGVVPLSPADPVVHHYVRVRAAGALGETLQVAAESLDLAGNLHTPLGADYPPVLLSGAAKELRYGAAVQGQVESITLKRLSNDPNSLLYNEYLSSPVVIVRQRLSPTQLTALKEIPGRVALWSGSFLRFGFDAPRGNGPAPDADLAPWLAEIQSNRLVPGVNRSYLGWPAEYIDSPNPSPPRLAPILAGVNLQSGEFSAPEADWHLEGRHQDILLQRVYQSRSQYIGPFGRGWDHNYNARIVVIPEQLEPGTQFPLADRGHEGAFAQPRDVLLIDGAGTVLLYREISEERGNLDRKSLYENDPALVEFYGLNAVAEKVLRFYDSPAGVFTLLVQLRDGRFVQIAPSGHRMVFFPNGKLDRLIGAFESSELVMKYRQDGLLDRVVGDRGLDLVFGYYFPFDDPRRVGLADKVSDEVMRFGRVAGVECSSPLTYQYAVDYEYDALGRLSKITPNLGKETILTWEPSQPDLLIRMGSTDGTGPPAVAVAYDSRGLVSNVEIGGSSFALAGAVATAKERSQNPGEVALTPKDGATVSISLDAQGSPKAFGGRELAADADTGLPTRFDSSDQRVELVYDSANPIHRFRGNVLRTVRGEPGQEVVSTMSFDGGACNRIKDNTTADGVTTKRQYTDLPTGALEVSETTGPVTRRLLYNAFGQLETEEHSGGGALQRRTTHGLGSQPADADLPSRSQLDTENVIRRDRFGRAEFSGKTSGLGWTMQYRAGTGEIEMQVPSTPIVPTTSFGYDTQLRLQQEIVDGGASRSESIYAYDDPRFPGRATKFTQSETGLPLSETSYNYNAQGQLETLVVDGETATYSYDGAQHTGVTGPGVEREMEYVPGGYQLRSLTENGLAMTFGYDANGRLETTESAGAVTTLTYAGITSTGGVSERVTSKRVVDAVIGETLVEESWTHDDAGRLRQVVSPRSGRTREFAYDADGGIRSNTINGQIVREVGRDLEGRVLSTRLNNLNIEFSNFDPGTGKPRRETLTFLGSTGGTTTIDKTFDAVGRPLTQTAGGVLAAFTWDRFGNLQTHTDGDDVLFSQTAAPGGLPLLITFGDRTSATHLYDVHRRRQSITTATGTIGFVYDEEGLVKQISYPDGTTSKFENRNAFFAPEKVVHGDVIQTHGYNAAGRLEAITVPGTGDSLGFNFDALGRTTAATLNDVTVGFGYTPGGAANAETITVGDDELGTWMQDLSALDHVRGETYPTGGFALTYDPDTYGQPRQIGGAGVPSVTWKAAGLPDEIRYDGGLTARHEYDEALRLTGVRYKGSSGGQPTLAGFRLGLTTGGRVRHEERLHDNRFDVFTRNGPAEAMRITGFAFGASSTAGNGAEASLGDVSFINGEIGTPSSQSNPTLNGPDPRGFFPAITRAPGGSPRVESIAGTPVAYDSTGSMSSFPLWLILPGQTTWTQIAAAADYDGLGNLARINRADGVTVSYTRDGLGRIHERAVSGPQDRCRPGKTRYRWKGEQLIEEHERLVGAPSFLLTRRYIWLDTRLVLVQAATTPGSTLEDYIPLVSVNGSVGGFVSRSGTLLETIHYSAYGAPYVRAADDGGAPVASGRSRIGPTVLFHGGWYDDQSGLYKVGQRTLHPFAGIFLQRDSSLYAESLAWFTAFNGDPAGRQDPTGTISDRQKELIDFAGQNKALYDAAKEIHEPLTGLVKAIGEGDPLEIVGGLATTTHKTIGLYTTLSDEDVQERYKLITDSLDSIKSGVDLLKAVRGIRQDRELLRAISVFTGAGGTSASVELRNLARLGAGASSSDVRDSILQLSGSTEIHNRAIQVRGKPQSAAKFYHEQRSEAAKRRKEHLGAISTGVHTLGKALVAQYLADDEPAKRVANQFIALSEANFDLANSVTEVLGTKKLSSMRISLNPLRPKRALASMRRFALNADARSAVSLAFKAGQEAGKFGIVFLCDEDVGKAYLETVKQFEEDGGYLTVASGVLSTYGFDEAAFKIQQLHDSDGIDQVIQTLFEENRRGVQRRESYLNGISEP